MRNVLTGTKKVRSAMSYNNKFNIKCLEYKTIFLSQACQKIWQHNSVRSFHFTSFLQIQDISNNQCIENIISSKNIIEDTNKLMEEISKFHAVFGADLEYILGYIHNHNVHIKMEFLEKKAMNLQCMFDRSKMVQEIHIKLNANYKSPEEIRNLYKELDNSLVEQLGLYKTTEIHLIDIKKIFEGHYRAVQTNIPEVISELLSHMKKIEQLHQNLPKYIEKLTENINHGILI